MDEMDLPVLIHAQDYRVDNVPHEADPLQEHMGSKPKQTNSIKWQFDNDFRYTETDTQLRNNVSREQIYIDGWSNIPNLAMDRDSPEMSPQSKGPARTICNPLEAWLLLLDEPLLNLILQKTNIEIRTRRGKNAHERVTDLVELRAWFGLNYLAGLFRNSTHTGPLDELWSLELGNAVFRVTMSIQRYEFLANCIQLSCQPNLQNFGQNWKKFIINCRSYYSPSTYVVMDVDIKNTELLLCDAQTLYLHNKIKLPANQFQLEKIYDLVGDIKASGRIVINATKYTSLDMAELLKSYELAFVGMLDKSNKCEEMETISNECQAYIMYRDSLALYEGSILTNCISNTINAKELFETTHESCKKLNETLLQYDTNYATPLAEQSNENLQECHNLLNYAGYNAWILMRLSSAEEMNFEYRDFLRCLGLYLTQQHLRRKLAQPDRLSISQKVLLCELLDEPLDKLLNSYQTQTQLKMLPIPEGTILKSRINDKRIRCRKCKGKNSPKTRVRCQQCLRSLCYRHIVFRCDDCTGVTADLSETNNSIEIRSNCDDE